MSYTELLGEITKPTTDDDWDAIAKATEAIQSHAADAGAGRDYVGDDCTLNGEPATIIGRLLDFGTVATIDNSRRAEYAWSTIARVMREKEGRFAS